MLTPWWREALAFVAALVAWIVLEYFNEPEPVRLIGAAAAGVITLAYLRIVHTDARG
jgi:hypothetical protein